MNPILVLESPGSLKH